MRTIKILCLGEHVHEVHAVVLGEWAAHPGMHRDEDCSLDLEDWSVTMVASARCLRSVTGSLLPEQAIALARILDETVPPIADWRKLDEATKGIILSTIGKAVR